MKKFLGEHGSFKNINETAKVERLEEMYELIQGKYGEEYLKIKNIDPADVISVMGDQSNDNTISFKFLDYVFFTLTDVSKQNMDVKHSVSLFANKIVTICKKH